MARPRQHTTEMATFNAYLPKHFLGAMKEKAAIKSCSVSEIVRDAIYRDMPALIEAHEKAAQDDPNQMEMKLDD